MDTVEYILDQKSPKSQQPDDIYINLRPHQLASLYRMCMIDRDCGMTMKAAGIQVRSNIAILADLAGYGKTITFLALISVLKRYDTQWIVQDMRANKEYIGTTLIVVPDALIDHWQRHLDDYTDLNYETIDDQGSDKIILDEYDVILCPAQYYNEFMADNREYFWNRVAFDEPDSINIPNAEKVDARLLWLITATFDNIIANKNLHKLFKPQKYWDDPTNPYFFPMVVKGTDVFVKESFNIMEPETIYIDCLTPAFITIVRETVNSHILELINAGDLDGAIIALGGNVNSDRNIIDLVTRGIKKDIAYIEAKIDKNPQLRNKLESLQTRISSLEQAISNVATNDCTICCDNLKHPTLVPCCNNIFCASCLLEWMKNSQVCPLCRCRFDPIGLHTISDVVACTNRAAHPSKKNKMATLVEIIKNNPSGKYLIFSGHQATLHEIGCVLDYETIDYGLLTSSQIKITLEKFREGQLSTILLNAEYNGAGLEIPQATDIILFHEMRKSLETQAIARAQRPGRIGKLRVWKLRYQHEYADAS